MSHPPTSRWPRSLRRLPRGRTCERLVSVTMPGLWRSTGDGTPRGPSPALLRTVACFSPRRPPRGNVVRGNALPTRVGPSLKGLTLSGGRARTRGRPETKTPPPPPTPPNRRDEPGRREQNPHRHQPNAPELRDGEPAEDLFLRMTNSASGARARRRGDTARDHPGPHTIAELPQQVGEQAHGERLVDRGGLPPYRPAAWGPCHADSPSPKEVSRGSRSRRRLRPDSRCDRSHSRARAPSRTCQR